MNHIVKQGLYISKFKLTGYFRYREYFQLIPFPTDERLELTHHFLFILQIVENVDRLREQAPSEKRDTEAALRRYSIEERTVFQLLKFFLREDLCGYDNSESFFHYYDGNEFINRWGKRGYWGKFEWKVDALSDISAMTRCATAKIDTYYHREYPDLFEQQLIFPENLSALLDEYFMLSAHTQKTFMTAINLFNQSMDLWDSNPSIAMVCMTSSVESLFPVMTEQEKELAKCKKCNQVDYKPTAKFRKFLKDFGDKSRKYEKLRERIYEFRSRFLHAGELLKHELYGFEEKEFPFKDEHFRRTARNFIRICIINWLIEQPKINRNP